ncbi:MAG: hypothetical protein GF368_05610 [Candidatus Aenigmarchaeota archaeon]|nr:hypothetical protein [Candidatus Aenigmarchaeota archaeon]
MEELLEILEEEEPTESEELESIQFEEEKEQKEDSNGEKEQKRPYQSEPKNYTPYHPVQENLESTYFPPGLLGFTKPSTGEAFVNPDVYGQMREVVKLHERLHLIYPHLDETSIRVMTNNLSGGPYVPTGRAY